VGQRFGRGVVIDPEIRVNYLNRRSRRGARLRCDCGRDYQANLDNLLKGDHQSCGCLRRDVAGRKPTHGLYKHPLYLTWYDMIQRCTNPQASNYPNYGGRGIRVCDRWLPPFGPELYIRDIERWLGPKPPGMQLDRICNDHDYRLDNMRYATRSEQAYNRRPKKAPRAS
jgi:hypothetical protein